MKIVTIIGARPQFVKAAVLSRELRKCGNFEEVIIHTGQHFDTNMSEIFFEEMDIPKPNYNLNIHGLSHGAMAGQMIEGIEKILLIEKPEIVLVYGDTNSTIAGAFAAKKLHIQVAHVEAGLRSYNIRMPEEINRILTDRISDWLFCPTDAAIENLQCEGFGNFNSKIIKSGDVMEDAAKYYAKLAEAKSTILSKLKIESLPFVLGTIHRAENTDDLSKLKNLVAAFDEINKTTKVIIPLHPRTKNLLENNNIKMDSSIIDPVGYFDMLMLLKNCQMVITDSGGLQKEAFFFRKYCITIREQTEWIELVSHGYNYIAGTDSDYIVRLYNGLADKDYPDIVNLYGNGQAALNICRALSE
jgi:UDP-GlcNAc3NAcA epimerase